VSREGERTVPGGAEHARAFYEEWDFAKQAVCLYTAGLAWKGARIGVLLAAADDIDWRGQVEEQALRETLQDWVIDGRTTVAFSRETPIRLVARGTPDALEIPIETARPAGMDDGVSLLWPACSNHETLKELSRLIGVSPGAEELLSFLLDDAHTSLGLPRWALDPAQAASAAAAVVTSELHWYRLSVHNWRRHLGFSIEHGLRERLAANEPQLVEVLLDWNEEWFPEGSIRGWEGVYEAFDRCGVTLVRFAEEFPPRLRAWVDSGMLARSILAGWEKLRL
jgi:hypothetical protein